jgi:hypothetical protein
MKTRNKEADLFKARVLLQGETEFRYINNVNDIFITTEGESEGFEMIATYDLERGKEKSWAGVLNYGYTGSIMPYLGKDRSGLDIYAGDKLLDHKKLYGEICVVEHNVIFFGFNLLYTNENVNEIRIPLEKIRISDLSLIGNIYNIH